MSNNQNNNHQGKNQRRHEKLLQITDSNFKYYCDEVGRYLQDGIQYINIEGIGTNIPTAIRVAETFVQRKQADWDKLHTGSIEKQNGQKGKKVCINACIKRK
ncbi:hypothetical protein ABPG72_007021 [Tetrahymena utriculariae]